MQESFNLSLAQQCAEAFSNSTGIGCVISNICGDSFSEFGYGCSSCKVCQKANQPHAQCITTHNHSMNEAERFGGRYIYYCPMGLTCFVSPILGELRSSARITAGPFLMVEKEDYIACELQSLLPEQRAAVIEELCNIPEISAQKVNHMSILLSMAVGFLNKVSASERMRKLQTAGIIQGQINSYILQIKRECKPDPYPFDTEKLFLGSIARSDKKEARRLLNELLGHILFASGQQLDIVKSRVCELLTLTGRAVIDIGADKTTTLELCHSSNCRIAGTHNIDEMCFVLSEAVNSLMDSVFLCSGVQHAQIIYYCMQYIEKYYYEKISLAKMAEKVFLSPSYLCRIFKQETDMTFKDYLNSVRVEKAKQLLCCNDLRIADVANAVGFDDQSYFTKVFRRVTGVNPLYYRTKAAKVSVE